MSNILCPILRNDFLSFVRQSFGTVVPGQRFQMNWHIDAMAHALEQVRLRKIKRLAIFVPPRSLKSLLTTVAMPAWLLAQDPGERIICASYSQELANTHARDSRAIMESRWYRSCFPKTRIAIERNATHDFMTTQRGGRLATSVGGTLTGRGGSRLIFDDLHKPDEAPSDALRERTIEWYRQTASSRLDDKENDTAILIMQRVHARDIAGFILEDPSWHVLDLPAIAEEDQAVPLSFGRTHHRRQGEVLFPARESRETLERQKQVMGSYAFAAQYQQRPAPLGGGLVKWSWFKTYDRAPEKTGQGLVVQSWDIANSVSDGADYSVCTTWLYQEGRSYLLHVVRERLEYPELKRMVVAHGVVDFKADIVLIEKKNAGEPLLQELGEIGIIQAKACEPKGDKETRMVIETPAIECGNVFVPKEAPWLAEFQREIVTFPKGGHDDQIDSLSQYLYWVRERETTRDVPRLWLLGEPTPAWRQPYTGGSLAGFMRGYR